MSNDKHETLIDRLRDYLTADSEKGPASFGDGTPIGAGARAKSLYLSTDGVEKIQLEHNGRTYQIQMLDDGLEVVEVDDVDR